MVPRFYYYYLFRHIQRVFFIYREFTEHEILSVTEYIDEGATNICFGKVLETYNRLLVEND